MDKFTRIYSIVLAGLVVAGLVWVFYESPGVSRVNAALEAHAELRGYPYRFRALELSNGVATLSTPRSAEFPAYRALGILYPALEGEDPDSAAMVEAQQELARVQGIAREVAVADEDVNRVVWELDERWLRANGIDASML